MNVATLKNLLDQSESLSGIIRALGEADADRKTPELKKQLEALKEQISKSIAELTRQTEQLFDSYNMLIDEVFGKK